MALPDAIEWPVSARPVIRNAGMFPLSAEHFSYAYNSATHALHLHEYAGAIRLCGREFRLTPGTLTLSPAQLDSSYHLPRPGVHWCVHFDPQRPRRAEARIAIPLVRPAGAAFGETVGRFAQIARLHAAALRSPNDAPLLRAAASTLFQALLVSIGLLDHSAAASVPRDDVLERLFEYIDRNLDRPIRAAELAEQAGLSRNYLARLVRQRIGQTLPRYVLMRRIEAARLLLATTNLPIKQIARRVGLPDPHHFNKQFRALAGMSPSAYAARRALK